LLAGHPGLEGGRSSDERQDQTARRCERSPHPLVALRGRRRDVCLRAFGERGILHIFKLKSQQGDLQQQLAQVEELNGGLRKEIASLSADRRHLERLARSQLGMVREDEVVYQFASKTRPAPPAPPAATPASSR